MERRISRRRALHGAGGLALAAALQSGASAAADLTGRVARYMAEAAARPLPARVARAAKQRILDTLAAMVSGATLSPGKLAMGARNGVAAAALVEAGFTGVADALEGERNVFDALRVAGAEPAPEQIVAALGERFYIEETAIKTYPVGYPIQAPLDAFLSLVREQRLKPDDVRRIVARLPADGARIVDGRAMPDVNCQHILAVALVDGAITLENSHARERMTDTRVLAVRERVELVADSALVDPAAPRSGGVEITLANGRRLERFVRHAPGTPENPLDDAGVNGKARGLMEPVLGAAKTDALIRRVNALDDVADVRELRTLLT